MPRSFARLQSGFCRRGERMQTRPVPFAPGQLSHSALPTLLRPLPIHVPFTSSFKKKLPFVAFEASFFFFKAIRESEGELRGKRGTWVLIQTHVITIMMMIPQLEDCSIVASDCTGINCSNLRTKDRKTSATVLLRPQKLSDAGKLSSHWRLASGCYFAGLRLRVEIKAPP